MINMTVKNLVNDGLQEWQWQEDQQGDTRPAPFGETNLQPRRTTIVHHSSCNKNFQKSKTTLKIVFISYSVNVDEDGQDERGSHGDQGQRSQPGQTGEQVEVGTRRGREIHCACAKANIVWIFQPIGGLDGKKTPANRRSGWKKNASQQEGWMVHKTPANRRAGW